MRLHVDGRKALKDERTGVGHYSRQLLKEWRDREIIVHSRSGPFGLFHLQQAVRLLVLNRDDRYYSPESLIVPILVGKRSALTIHDITPITHPGRHTLRNRIVHKVLLRAAIRRSGVIFAPTRAVLEQIQRMFPASDGKIVAVHEGPRQTKPLNVPVPSESTPPKVLYVGTLEPRKNVASAVRAFLTARVAPWEMDVVGRKGWLSDEQWNELEALFASPYINYRSYVSDEDLSVCYATATVFVYISEAEGFGLPPLEAMAYGLPVIVSSDPALQEVVGGAGLTVELGDQLETQTTSQLQMLLDDSEMRRTLGEAGAARASLFSWHSMAERMFAEISRL